MVPGGLEVEDMILSQGLKERNKVLITKRKVNIGGEGACVYHLEATALGRGKRKKGVAVTERGKKKKKNERRKIPKRNIKGGGGKK